MNIRFIIAFLLVIAPFAPSSHALEFRLLSWSGTIEDLKYTNGQKPIEVAAWDSALSPPYKFTGTGPLVFFREVLVDDKKVRVPVATLPPPEGITHAIILMAATDSSGQAYTAIWMNDSPEVRKAQTITYRNFSSYPVVIKLGTEEIPLDPKEVCTRTTNPELQRLPLQIAARTTTGWEVISSLSQPIRPGLRTLVLLRDGRMQPSGIKALVDCLAFNDLPPPPKPPADAAGAPGPSVASR